MDVWVLKHIVDFYFNTNWNSTEHRISIKVTLNVMMTRRNKRAKKLSNITAASSNGPLPVLLPAAILDSTSGWRHSGLLLGLPFFKSCDATFLPGVFSSLFWYLSLLLWWYCVSIFTVLQSRAARDVSAAIMRSNDFSQWGRGLLGWWCNRKPTMVTISDNMLVARIQIR